MRRPSFTGLLKWGYGVHSFKGGYTRDRIVDYCRDYKGGCWELRPWFKLGFLNIERPGTQTTDLEKE